MIFLILKILATLALAALAGWAYRFGGSSNGVRWAREVGVGLAVLGGLTIWLGWNWWGLLVMGCVWIETTYFKAKGTDAKWYNWLIVGLSYSIVPLPYIIAQSFSHKYYWIGFGIRTFVVTLFTTLWRTFVHDVQWQEGGSGAIQVLTLPLLFIGA